MANAIIVKPATITAASAGTTAAGVPLNVANDFAGITWQSGATASSIDLQIDLGADTPIDTVMLFGLELAPSTAQVSVLGSTAAQASFAPPTWQGAAQALFAGSATPTSGKGVMVWSVTPGSLVPVRYLLLRFTNAANFAIRAARVVAGARLTLSRNFSFGAGFGVRDLGTLDFSRRGVLLRTRGAKLRTLALTFSNIRKDEAEAGMKQLLEQLGNTEPVAVLTDPAADAQRQLRAYFGPLVGELSLKWRNAAAWEAGINLVSLF